MFVEFSPSLLFEEAAFAPELVSLRAILGVRVSDHVPTMAAAQNHYSTHLVVRNLVLVTRNIGVSSLHYDVAGFAVVDGVQY